jgi:hypothetical protein
MGSLFYPAHIVGHFTNSFEWWQAAQLSPLFHFAVSRSPRVSFQCTAVNVRILLTVFKESVPCQLQPSFMYNLRKWTPFCRPGRWTFSVGLICPTANSELLSKFHVALHAFHAALQTLTKRRYNTDLQFQPERSSNLAQILTLFSLLHSQSTSHHLTLFISQCSILPACLYQKDERTLPGILQTHKLLPCNKLIFS